MDLSGELYADESRMKGAGSTSNAAVAATSQQEPPAPKKKSGFRAAMGAVRELLR